MTLTRGQTIMCGVVLAVAMLLATSVRMNCSSNGAGSIKLTRKKSSESGTGKPFHPTKTQTSGRH